MLSNLGKTPRDSWVTMTELVLPHHTNQLGTVFGGTVMSWMDICGAIAAFRHVGGEVVTASVDDLHFLAPIYLGWIVEITGHVCYAGNTSVDVWVEVNAENPHTRERSRTAQSFLTFVARDVQGQPKKVPPLILETEQDHKLHELAKLRRSQRLQRKQMSQI
ncbi:MAG: acyl-CoA thioesterase [Bdellovibrionaceae bacterium]|nr:acyl-CoA thioesterase [Pseudobdellovibrionaceae bacterium]MDW8191160.1 acyl-CoA thioesterase [Pseudobdellovibrionaceae bacterium]